MRFPSCVCWLLLAALLASPAAAQCEVATIGSSDLAQRDAFGHSVCLLGSRLIVGVPNDDDACPSDPACDSGSAYIYELVGATWVETAKLVASDAAAGDWFGWSVALINDQAVVGAPRAAGGAAYVFSFDGTTWTQTQKLIASDAGPNDQFGTAVAAVGDQLVIGAPIAQSRGAAYVFMPLGPAWLEVERLSAPIEANAMRFGAAVAVSQDLLVVGAPETSPPPVLFGEPGAVFVYERQTSPPPLWLETEMLISYPSSNYDNSQFGWSVAVDVDRILVGAPEAPGNTTGRGEVQLFERSGSSWDPTRLWPLDWAESIDFGHAIAFSGDAILVGDPSAGGSGQVHQFEFDGALWVESERYFPPLASSQDEFGWSLAADGSALVVGSRLDDAGCPSDPLCNSGAAFVFVCGPGEARCFGDGSFTACPCANDGNEGQGCRNSTGQGAVLGASGTDHAEVDDLALHVAQARPNQTGLFLQGTTTISVPFRDGILCVGDPTVRLEPTTTDAAGSAVSTVSIVTKGAVAPGDSRTYQFWYRDPNLGPCHTGSNLTNAYLVHWQ